MTTLPFEITKAHDFSDSQILQFWVDVTGKDSFTRMIKPKSKVPLIIMGAKGSGKTHLMRYHSFPIQKLRTENDLLEGIRQAGFLGIYTLCSGLNPGRFKGKNIADEKWDAVFAYYFELWLSLQFCEIIDTILISHPGTFDEEEFVKGALAEFEDSINLSAHTLKSLIEAIELIQKDIDHIVNNAAITNDISELQIKVSVGNLIFGLPKLIANLVEAFSAINFFYLIDEFENFNEAQQRHINSLIRDRVDPVSFRIGVRMYGLKTLITNSADEINKEGSEFEKVIVDEFIRKNKSRNLILKNICTKRLDEYFNANRIHTRMAIDSYFESPETEIILKQIAEKYAKTKKPYFLKLETKLKLERESQIVEILENLKCDGKPFIERVNIFMFYRLWKSKKYSLINASEIVKSSMLKYLDPKSTESEHKKIIEKFESDILAQLYSECSVNNVYSGFNILVELAHGIPRVLIVLLKNITKWSVFNGEKPFETPISIASQINGCKDTAEWFWSDVRYSALDDDKVKNCIGKLAELLREVRFSDLPPECSIVAFTYDDSVLDEQTKQLIKRAEQLSYIIRLKERVGKNSKKLFPKYHLNKILTPKWDLPIYKRGELSIDNNEINAIFNNENYEVFEKILKQRKTRYNAPFRSKEKPEGLF